MPDRDLDRLRRRLLESGVAPRRVVRIVSELSDHYDDLELEATERGLSREAAKAHAKNKLGDASVIAEQVLSQPELKCWFYRFPKLARVLLPVAYVALLPIAPIYAGVAHASVIGRWCACLVISGFVTAAMMLVMQVAIRIG